jgi:hypothetical protein
MLCMFCKEPLIKEVTYYTCYNHNNITMYCWNSNLKYPDKIDEITITIEHPYYENYCYIRLFLKDNKMKICSYLNNSICLPLDLNLTPENFESKLKTYLNFL